MTVTRTQVAEQLSAYLQHRISLHDLVDWAESAMMEADFAGPDGATLTAIVARLGLADVRAFDLSWQECEAMLEQLGFQVHLQIVAA